jgi:hypothetical protein
MWQLIDIAVAVGFAVVAIMAAWCAIEKMIGWIGG